MWVVIAITIQHKWKAFQMDVKSTFSNGVLKEEVYMEKPLAYEVLRQERKVYRLKKALYRLKQALEASYNRFDSYLIQHWL